MFQNSRYVLCSYFQKNKSETIGKPYVTEEKNNSDHVLLRWNHDGELDVDDFYQIRMKKYPVGNWKDCKPSKPIIERAFYVDGLKAKTSFVFKVRVANSKTGEEGSFSSESDVITTGESPAFKIMRMSEQIEVGDPAVYKLPIHEVKQARNERSQTRKFILGTYFIAYFNNHVHPLCTMYSAHAYFSFSCSFFISYIFFKKM